MGLIRNIRYFVLPTYRGVVPIITSFYEAYQWEVVVVIYFVRVWGGGITVGVNSKDMDI